MTDQAPDELGGFVAFERQVLLAHHMKFVAARVGLGHEERVVGFGPEPQLALAGGKRSDVVKALVQADVKVETVTARRRLEEAFLGLVEADRAAS